jgi:hypothetical protein
MKRLAILGNHLPRQCGIATFTTHLADALTTAAPDVDSFVLAMNDAGRRHTYPSRVRFEIAEGDLGSHERAADYLNVNQVDVLWSSTSTGSLAARQAPMSSRSCGSFACRS